MLRKKYIYEIIQGKAEKELKKLPSNKFDLIITSPPYNLGKEYESREKISDYIKKQEKVIKEVVRLTSKRGSVCWQVGNFINQDTKELFPLDVFYYDLFKKYGLILRNRIVWHFRHGLHSRMKFSGRYETILWFTKTNNYIFNLDPIRVDPRYPGKKSYKGPNKGKYSSNPNGKNPSDVWDVMYRDWENEVWDIPNVKANHVEKTEHPCQYPIELVERFVLALTDKGDWVLDPFVGVGSSILACLKNDRNVIGIEKLKKYKDNGLKYIVDYLNVPQKQQKGQGYLFYNTN